ncbi:MAG: peptide chain release factor N(5)-glutamine methyltransferase [Syntrophomonadaceae bacterium]|nr:peptide chain release factor N(5)-glutamine methyltransferase [Syntrophomonadaceae bacterium]
MAQANDWTISKCLTWTAQYFAKHHLDNPRLEAEVLLGRALGQTRVQVYMNLDQPMQPVELARYRELIRRRIEGTPTAYLLGEKEFMSLTFEVNRQVLIPRPETEVLVETALELLGYSQRDKAGFTNAGRLNEPKPAESALEEELDQGGRLREGGFLLIDVGTGSGNIAITLARFLPQAKVIGLDISAKALEVAARNASRHEVSSRVAFYEGDLLAPLAEMPQLKGQIDLITANLPYIPSDQLPHLMKEVLQEPIIALDGGRDGLMYYRRLVPQALEYLKPGGYLLLEIAHDQGRAARKLFGEGWEKVELRPDYAGRDRVVLARTPRRDTGTSSLSRKRALKFVRRKT